MGDDTRSESLVSRFSCTELEPLLFGYMSLGLRQGGFCVQLHYWTDPPCGTKFLLEFIFGDRQFFVFWGNYFLRLGQIGFSCYEWIFAIFRKPGQIIDNVWKSKGRIEAHMNLLTRMTERKASGLFVNRSSSEVLGDGRERRERVKPLC